MLTSAHYSHIKSAVVLSSDSNSGGKFDVKAHTSNGRVELGYEDSPLNALLTSDVTTSNSRTSVKMHPAFEGTFDISSSNVGPVLSDNHVQDPSGRGRQRIISQNRNRNRISGSVYWAEWDGDRRHVKGTSVVHTSNAQATLEL